MKRFISCVLLVISSVFLSHSQVSETDKDFQNFLILSQYGCEYNNYVSNNKRLFIDMPWYHETVRRGDAYKQINLWTGGFISHLDLSPDDIISTLDVYSKYYTNVYGEYIIPEHIKDREYIKHFRTTQTDGEIRIVCDNGYHHNGIYFYKTNPLRYMGDDTNVDRELGKYVTIVRADKVTKYAPTGETIKEAPIKYSDGKITEIDIIGNKTIFRYEGDKLKDVVNIAKSSQSESKLISFCWEDKTLKSFSYTLKDGVTYTFYTKVLSVNDKGLWTELQLYEIIDGEEVPYVLYERVFDNKKNITQNQQNNQTKEGTHHANLAKEDNKIDLNNYLLISQYSNFIERPWMFIKDVTFFIDRLFRDGFYAHCDLSIDDIDFAMTVTGNSFKNQFGEYVLNNDSSKSFTTFKADDHLVFPNDGNSPSTALRLDDRKWIEKRDNSSIILHKDKNKAGYYDEKGLFKKEINCQFDDRGRIEFIHRPLNNNTCREEGYYITYDESDNITNIELKEYTQAGYQQYSISKTTNISLLWNDAVPAGFTITETKHWKGITTESLIMKSVVLETNTEGKWSKIQLNMIQNGAEVPMCLYSRNFYKTPEEFQASLKQ